MLLFCNFQKRSKYFLKKHPKSTIMKNLLLFIIVFWSLLSPIISNGQPEWSRLLQIGTEGNQNVNAIISDSENIYLAASISGQTTFEGTNFTSIGVRDMLLAKITNSGIPLWKKQVSPEALGTIYANAIKTDLNGQIYVTGTFYGTVIIGGSIITSSPTSNAFLAKFDSNGNGIWATSYINTGSGSSRIAFDNNANIFLISKTSKLLKFNQLGILQWEQSYPDRTLQSISVAGDKLYLGGALQKSTAFGSLNLQSVGAYNKGFLVMGDLNGIYTKSITAEGSPTNDGSAIGDMIIDQGGNIIITGGYTKDLVLGSLSIPNTKRSYYTFIAKCDADFNFLWVKSSGELTDNFRSIWTYRLFSDDSNNLYELGLNSCSFLFGGVNITNTAGNQFLIKFDKNGNALNGYPVQNVAQDKAVISPSGKLQLGGSYNYSGAPSYGNFFLKQFRTDLTLEWAKSSTQSLSSGSVSVNRIKHDPVGNTYLQARVLGNFGLEGNQISTNEEITVISKIDINGNVAWINTIKDIKPDNLGSTFILDKDNNVLTIGLFKSSIEIGSLTLTSNNAGYEGYVAKYKSDGTFLWASKFDLGKDISKNMTIAADQEGKVIVSGVVDPANYLIKYDANGKRLWANLLPMESHYLSLVSTDGNNNIYMTSEIHLSDGTGTASLGSLQFSQTKSDGSTALIKFDPSGNPLWAKTYGGVTGAVSSDGWPCSIKTDLNGNSYLWGWCPNNAIFGSVTLTNPFPTNQGYSLFLSKINTSGEVVWTKSVFETKNGYNYGDLLDLDNHGNVYVGGHFKDLIQIEGNGFRPEGINDFFMAKFSESGNFQWIKTITANSDIIGSLSVQYNNIASVGGYAGINSLLGSFPINRKGGSNCIIATLGNLTTQSTNINKSTGRVYPNPATSTLFLTNLNETVLVKIFDINGKILIQQKIRTNQINIDTLPTGFYFIQIEGEKASSVQKFVKQ